MDKAVIEIFASGGYKVYPESILEKVGKIYFLVKKDLKKYLVSDDIKFAPNTKIKIVGRYNIYEKVHANALKLRKLFPHLAPVSCGTKKSFGFGDRLGLATPGHIEAIQSRNLFPIFSQQSIREMERTGRSMEDVLDDGMWGVFEKGYKKGYGADIDHVKKENDLVMACKLGYTMYTIDPSDYVNDKVKDMSKEKLISTYETIPDRPKYEKLYLGKVYRIGGKIYKMDKLELMKIVSVYAQALKHIIKCYNLIKEKISFPFDFEASVDETKTSTTPLAHIFIVEELKRNKVRFTSLALRFIGEFEKGIDYIGDLKLFRKEFLIHLDINNYFKGYKLSIHSASDKFSIYPIIGESSSFHIKTAGTSWLEGVRLISHKAPQLFRKMHNLSLNNFEKDRQSYHITTDLSKIPDPARSPDERLPELLNENNSRQLMHITYGTLLKNMGEEIYKALNLYEDEHYQMLATHLGRHLELL